VRVGGEWATSPFSGPGAFSPIGGLFSTITDLARWMQWFVDASDPDAAQPPAGAPPDPLTPAARREMQQGYRIIAPASRLGLSRQAAAGYGFGLVVSHDERQGTIVSHSGGYPGFSSHMRWHPATGLGIVALENATYSDVARPATEAMRVLLDDVRTPRGWRPWPETLAAQAALSALLVGWDDTVALDIFSDNAHLDEPLDRRRDKLRELVARAGALGPTDQERSRGPNERMWRIRGENADLRCELTMNPRHPPKVQTFDVQVDSGG
jgi:CubicO group peptidase (beta-lactamase class C family)